MGMFDEIKVWERIHHFVSADGEFVSDYQTKSLSCDMNNFIIHDGILWRIYDSKFEYISTDEDKGRYVFVSEKEMVPEKHSGKVVMYSEVKNVKPILIFDEGMWGDHVREQRPWFELEVEFESGRLTNVVKLKDGSREQLREKLLKQGAEVLSDDDRVARIHFMRMGYDD